MTQSHFSVTFFGVRGSLPTPIKSPDYQEKLLEVLALANGHNLQTQAKRKAFIQQLPDHLKYIFGGNTSCLYVQAGDRKLIFDGGSGLRELGITLMKGAFAAGEGQADLFFTHTHWDHIMGLPFFTPLYIKGNRFNIGGVHPNLEQRLRYQQEARFFPVPFEAFNADISFINLAGRPEYKVGDLTLSWLQMHHPGKSYAYRVDYAGKSLVFATDAEYKDRSDEAVAPVLAFFKDADILIFDSQYTMIECLQKEDWGHSSTYIGMDLALRAGVKQLVFFHHEPTYNDFQLNDIYTSSKDFLNATGNSEQLKLTLAREGLILYPGQEPKEN